MRSGRALIMCALTVLAILLAGCGGDDVVIGNPDPVVGAGGGIVTEVSGASVVVPAGAIGADTTIRIARDSTGAPAMPEGLVFAGNTYVITPHGGNFASPVEVRIPAPNLALQPNQEFKLAKAQPGGEWVVLEDTRLDAGMLSTRVDSFSFFTPVVVSYLLPIAQVEPMRMTITLDCACVQCSRAFGAVNATYTVTTNNGQLPQPCVNPRLAIYVSDFAISYGNYGSGPALVLPMTGGALARTFSQTLNMTKRFGLGKNCGGNWSAYTAAESLITWVRPPSYPNLAVLNSPATLDVVAGVSNSLDVAFSGGASRSPDYFNAVSAVNRTVVEWERSDDNGSSWRVVSRSYEDEANPWPYAGAPSPYYYWSVRHEFVGAITDQGALIRAHACYIPIGADAPPCVTGAVTRLNVLQQSLPPTFTDAPRSILIRTGQTANLSVAASGLPAPKVRWQTRPANSNGAWQEAAGATARTSAYTTVPLMLVDNGMQYRAVATNPLGEAQSNPVTVSVSDLDVAPSIATQPASLNVAAGSDAVFAVDARGTEALSYQWSRNGIVVAGANSPVLRLPAVTNASAGSYAVTVSNDAGNVISNAAVLSVSPGVPAAVAPTVVTQPAAVTVSTGNTATFAVGVDGSGPFTFQWRKDGVNIPGSNGAVLTLPAVTSGSAGSYSVVVGNSVSAGVASAAATLTVSSAGGATTPSIATQPSTLVVAPGGSGLLAVAATGSGPLSYQWLNDGFPLVGETTAVLLISNASQGDEGRYSVSVSNSLGAVVSQEVQVILLGAPLITLDPADASRFENTTATFTVAASGSGIRYQWLRNNFMISGATAASYTTPSLLVTDSGAVFSVIVYNGAGVAVSQGAVLSVQVPVAPTILQQPADVSVVAGQPASLCMAFGGVPPFSVQLNRWNGSQWTAIGTSSLADNAQHCIATPVLQLADSGAQFRLFAANAGSGNLTAMTRIVTTTVTASPQITATTLVSVSSSGITANYNSVEPSMSANGRLVAFISEATNLVPGATNGGGGHAYLRNLDTNVTTLINQTPSGGQSAYGVVNLKLAAGGRYAVFTSLAGDLVAGDTNGALDVFLRDLQSGTTKRLNLRADGSQIITGNSVADLRIDISADGRFVSFVSFFDLVGNGPEAQLMLYLRDTQSDQTRLVAANPLQNIAYAALSSDGKYLAYTFGISAPGLCAVSYYDVDANATHDLFTFDISSGSDYLAEGLSISGNGRYVAFTMRSAPLLNSNAPQVVVADRNAPGTFVLASTGSAGTGIGIGDAASAYPKLSDDGRYVLYATKAFNLSAGAAVAGLQVLMVRDLQLQTTSVASRRANGTSVPTVTVGGAYGGHALSGDGQMLAVTAAEYDMTGINGGYQVYTAPRP